jgi:heme-degrading monooxygenase HmoA
MEEQFYTHATWQVKAGNEEAFIAAWKAMGDAFLANPGAKHGTLIQSVADPTLFFSFGLWESLEQIQAMRNDPAAQEALGKAKELCAEATLGAYRAVAQVTR